VQMNYTVVYFLPLAAHDYLLSLSLSLSLSSWPGSCQMPVHAMHRFVSSSDRQNDINHIIQFSCGIIGIIVHFPCDAILLCATIALVFTLFAPFSHGRSNPIC
jgi:hypothetical protein